jgi:signal transduction histidine kinase
LKIQEEETLKQLADKEQQLKRKTLQTNFSIAIAILTLAFAIVLFRYYKEQKRLGRELLSLNTEKSNLISIVAHDLKSPLNQIKGLVSIIKMSSASMDKETSGYIQMIESSAIRLTNLIGKILDVEAIESKQLNLTIESVNFSELIQNIVSRYTIEAQRKKIQTYTSIADNVLVKVDRSYAYQVIENLFSNAIKFSPTDKNIYINMNTHQNKAIFEIRDEGPGLTADDKKKLFGKYQKLSAFPTANESSTGLGLSIVKRFVDAMNGEIWCVSEAGKGASFFVKFDLAS